MKEALLLLVKHAKAFMREADDAVTQGQCSENPCPYCTAATELQLVVSYAEDVLAIAEMHPTTINLDAEAYDAWLALLDRDYSTDVLPNLACLLTTPTVFDDPYPSE